MNDPLGLFTEEKDSDPLGLFSEKKTKTSILEDIKTGLSNAGNLADTAISMPAGALANLFSGPDAADQVFNSMNERIASRNDWANPDKKEQGISGKVISGLSPWGVASAGLSPATTAKTALDSGEDIPHTLGMMGVDALGNALNFVTPSVGGTVANRFIKGGAVNAAQDAITNKIISGIAQTPDAQKAFEPTLENAAASFATGGVMGMMSPRGTPTENFDDKLNKLLTEEKTQQLKPPPANMLPGFESPSGKPINAQPGTLETQSAYNRGLIDPETLKPQTVDHTNQIELPLDNSPETIRNMQNQGDPQLDMFSELAKADPQYEMAMSKQRANERLAKFTEDIQASKQKQMDDMFSQQEEQKRIQEQVAQLQNKFRVPLKQRGGITFSFDDAVAKRDVALENAETKKMYEESRNRDMYNAYKYLAEDAGKFFNNNRFLLQKLSKLNEIFPYIKDQQLAHDASLSFNRLEDAFKRYKKAIDDPASAVLESQNIRFLLGEMNHLEIQKKYLAAVQESRASLNPRSKYDRQTIAAIDEALNNVKVIPKKQRGAIDLDEIVSGIKNLFAVENLAGTKLHTPIPEPSQVIAAALSENSDGHGMNYLASGATLEGLKRRSALITGVSRIIQGNQNIAERQIRETVFPAENSLRKLGETGLANLARVLKGEMMGKQTLSSEQLSSLLSVEQLKARSDYKAMQHAAAEAQNARRRAAGLPEFNEHEYYAASVWQGDFRQTVRDSQGRVVWQLAADSAWGLKQQAKKLKEAFPDYVLEKQRVVKSGKETGDLASMYHTMLDVLGRDDPAVAKIKDWYEAETAAEAQSMLNQTKHHEHKANIRGFVGDRPGEVGTPKEYIRFIQKQINYAKNALRWSAMQEAGDKLKPIFQNEDLANQQPNNMKYVKEYYRNQLGMSDSKLSRALDDTIRGIGISPNLISNVINNSKAFFIAQKLAMTTGYSLSNLLQSANILPHMADIMVKDGGDPMTAIAAGMVMGPVMGTGHYGSKLGVDFYNMLNKAPYGSFLKQAMKYAEDNSVTARSVYDESPISTSFGVGSKISKVADLSLSLPETYLRSFAFIAFAQQLKNSGKYSDNLEIFRKAEERVNAALVDYRAGERPMIFNKMGLMGDVANTLQTYPMNYYNQWSWAMREAGKGNPLPFVAMFGVQYALAGAMGIPGFNDLDKLFEYIKDWTAENNPKVWAKIKDWSPKQMLLENPALGESAVYGSASTKNPLGVGITSRMTAPSISEMGQSPFAPAIDIAKQVGQVASLAMDPTNPQKQAQTGMAVLPEAVKGLAETSIFRDQMSTPLENGNRLYKKSSDLEDRKAVYERTPQEENIRKTGLRSQKEILEKDMNYMARSRDSQTQKALRSITNKMYNEMRNNNEDSVREYARLYSELSGKAITKKQIEGQVLEEFMDPKTQTLKQSKTLEAIKAYNRMVEILKPEE